MGKFKDQHGETRVGKFLKTNAPHILDMVGEVLPEQGALGMVKNLIQKDDKLTEDQKQEATRLIELDLEAFKLEIEDRKRATELFKVDSGLQKIFAIVFLIGYIFMTGVMFYGAYQIAIEGVKLENYLVSLITSVYTAMSMKVNTIVDFLFGGSFK